MSRGVRDIHEGTEIILNEAAELRTKNQQLYRLILQLISDLDELEDCLSAATTERSISNSTRQGN